MLAEFHPDVVIGVGGYASGPAMLAAILKRIPTLAFEPNVVPGFANRIVARWVSGAAVHFEETAQYFRHAKSRACRFARRFFRSQAQPTANRQAYVAGLRRKPGSECHQPGHDSVFAGTDEAGAEYPHHPSDWRARL